MKKSNFIVIGLLALSLSSLSSCSQRRDRDWDDDDDYRSNDRGYYHGGILIMPGMAGYNRNYHYNSMKRGKALRARGYSYGSGQRASAARSASTSRGGFGASSHSSYGG